MSFDRRNTESVNGSANDSERNSAYGTYIIRNYKLRIKGLFARLEPWMEKSTGIIKWRVISKENNTTLFGWSENLVLADPEDPLKIVAWYPEFVFDDKGNCSHYLNKSEDDTGFDPSSLHNKN